MNQAKDIIMKRKVLNIFFILLIFVQSLSGQDKTSGRKKITGLILDSYKNPVTEVLVMVDNKQVSPVISGKGRYRMRIRNDAKVITVLNYHLGSIEKTYIGQDTINFIFNSPLIDNKPSEKPVNVLNIGYGNVEESDLNADVTQITNNPQISAKYNNIFDMIKGELPGVIVSGNSIRIQGTSSITASNEPLFILNGMEIIDVRGINPSDVKSISLIRGPAASIYGSRGANGVIDIKLK